MVASPTSSGGKKAGAVASKREVFRAGDLRTWLKKRERRRPKDQTCPTEKEGNVQKKKGAVYKQRGKNSQERTEKTNKKTAGTYSRRRSGVPPQIQKKKH